MDVVRPRYEERVMGWDCYQGCGQGSNVFAGIRKRIRKRIMCCSVSLWTLDDTGLAK